MANISANTPKPLKAFLHSFSQVVLVENVISGILIVAAIFIFSWEVSNWNIGLAAVVAAIVGNITAKVLGHDEGAICSGLFGFNPVLVGIGAATFFTGIDVYIIAVLGSILVIPLITVINKICSRFGLPGLTMPFIAMTWFFILISFQTGLLTAVGREGTLVEVGAVSGAVVLNVNEVIWIDALTKGIGEIYLLDSVVASLVILVAFAIDRWHLAIKIAGAIVVSLIMGLIFDVDMWTLNMGLYTYNAILVLMGMETFSKNKDEGSFCRSNRYWLLVLLGLVFVCLVDYAMPTILMPMALPTLTFSFVLVTWGLLYFEQQLV